MKADLDRLMEEHGIDALMILPDESPDPYRAYLANGAVTGALAIKKRGEPAVLIANVMEVDEAAKSGLKVYSVEDFDQSLLRREHGDQSDAWRAAWYRRIFDRLDIRGKLGIYGVADVNTTLSTVRMLSQHLADRVEIVTDTVRQTVFDRAYETKDAVELERLRDVGARTSRVAIAVRDWIASHRASGEQVVQADGSPLTIGTSSGSCACACSRPGWRRTARRSLRRDGTRACRTAGAKTTSRCCLAARSCSTCSPASRAATTTT